MDHSDKVRIAAFNVYSNEALVALDIIGNQGVEAVAYANV